MIVPQSKWPIYLFQYEQLQGISSGTCIKTGKTFRKGCAAHAHCKNGTRYNGWICVPYTHRIRNELLMKHEIAHLIAGKEAGHGDEWKRICLELGGSLKSYRLTKKKWSKSRVKEEINDSLEHIWFTLVGNRWVPYL